MTDNFEIAIHTERLHDDRVWRRVVRFVAFLNRRGITASWFSVNPSYEAYRRMDFDEKKWIERLSYLESHGQRIEQHTHFYKERKGNYDLSAENVTKRLHEDQEWLTRHGHRPTRFISGGWRMSVVIANIAKGMGYADCTEDPRTLSPRGAVTRILTGRAGVIPPLLYVHDYELCNPLIFFLMRFTILYWYPQRPYFIRHPHDHKRGGDWRRITRFLGDFFDKYSVRSVLELGAGTGNISAYCVARGMRVVAEDINPHYLSLVTLRDPRIDTLCHDINSTLPYEDGSFDMVTCIGTLHYGYVRNPEAIMREMKRVARTYIIIDILSRYSLYRLFERMWNPHYTPRTYSAREAAHLFKSLGVRMRARIGGRALPFLGSLFPFSGKSVYFILEKNEKS